MYILQMKKCLSTRPPKAERARASALCSRASYADGDAVGTDDDNVDDEFSDTTVDIDNDAGVHAGADEPAKFVRVPESPSAPKLLIQQVEHLARLLGARTDVLSITDMLKDALKLYASTEEGQRPDGAYKKARGVK